MLQELFTSITVVNEMSKLDAALFYARVLPVFPCWMDTKVPMFEGSWKDYATQNEAQVRAWWTQYPDANIALPMGGEILCSDLDVKKGEKGWDSFQQLEPGEVVAPMQMTPSGGYHVIHGFVPGLINFTKKGEFGGIDMRTAGGYIVVAPSYVVDPVPEYTGSYQWLQGGEIKKLNGALLSSYGQWSTESTIDLSLEMPVPTPFDDLPALEGTMIKQKHLDFLNDSLVDQAYDGRSEAVLGATIALYQLGLSDEDVLGYLVGSPGSLDCAVDHSTDKRYTVWLWKYNCLKGRQKRDTTPMVTAAEAFQGIEILPEVPQMGEKERWINIAGNITQDQHEDAIKVYREAAKISPLFANQVADIMHANAGFRKSDIEKAAKQESKEIATSMRSGSESPLRGHGGGLAVDHPVLSPPALTIRDWCDAVGRYIYISTDNKWLDRCTRHTLAPEAVNTANMNIMMTLSGLDDEGLSMTNALAMRNDTLKVDVQSYWPGVLQDLIHVGNDDAVNTWQPTTLKAYTGDITPWWELFCHLFPDADSRDRIMDWMAYMLQNPEVKINHALLIGGGERIGKDSLFQPLIMGVGVDNVSNIKAETLDEKYDDPFINIKLAVVQEIYRSGFKDAKVVENKLKVYLADPPDVLLLRRLGEKHIKQRNLIQMLIFTNHEDALHLSSEGDRYLCEWSPAKKLPAAAYQKVYDWYNFDYGYEKVYGYLLSRDVSHFNPKGAAPSTKWRQDMFKGGKSDLDNLVEDIIDQIRQLNEMAVYNRSKMVAGTQITTANAHLYHEVLYITPNQVLEKIDIKTKPSSKAITNILLTLGLVKIDAQGTEKRHRVPRVFVEDTFAQVQGTDKFKSSMRVTMFLIDPLRTESLTPTHEEAKLGLCPAYLINDYLTSIN